VQDNCVVHVFKATHPTELEDHVTVGHSATLHGCRIESWCLIGMGATILNGAVIGKESIVAAGALVPEGMLVPPGSLVMGMPAKVRRPIGDAEREGLRRYASNYFEYKEIYLDETGGPAAGHARS
jgi:carbonic anhydrase/acetyltransferase-like protein (isoleucine patch superfamily)